MTVVVLAPSAGATPGPVAPNFPAGTSAPEQSLAAPAGGAPAVPAGPQLSIAIDNGRTATNTGDRLDYVITVQNLGTSDVEGLRISQSVPTGMDFGSADSDGVAGVGHVDWTINLKATTTATLHTTMTVSATPTELLRLATVACATTAVDAPPIVCASHSDQLPAGAAAEAAQAAMAAPPTTPPSQAWWYVLAGLAVFVVLGGLVAWWVIRQRRPATTEEAEVPALTR